MRAGALRHRVTIQERATGRDAVGQPVDSWQTFATRWAEVTDVEGRELVRDGAYSAQVTTLVRIRHLDGVTADMRVVHGSRTLELVGPPIDKEGRVRELELPCREVTP